jgi:hypothetical protein
MTTVPQEPVEFVEQVFTFGMGQHDPETGQSLADTCAIVIASSKHRCRDLMVEHYGIYWAFQYDSIEDCSGPTWTVTPHVTITDGDPASVVYPMPLTVYCPAFPGGKPVWRGNFVDRGEAEMCADRVREFYGVETVIVDRNAVVDTAALAGGAR